MAETSGRAGLAKLGGSDIGCWDCCCIGLAEGPEKSCRNIRWSKLAELGVAEPYGEVTELLLQGELMKEPGSDLGAWCGNVLERCI